MIAQVTRDMITTPAMNLVAKVAETDYHKSIPMLNRLYAIGFKLGSLDTNLVALHKEKLGPQARCWYGSEFRQWVWERPGCRVYVSNKQGVSFEVLPDISWEDLGRVLEDYLWDMGVSDRDISPSEEQALQEQGRDLVKGKELDIPNSSDEDLRKFVLGVCGGQIYTSNQCPPDMMQLVFMPLVFGAMSPPDEITALLDPVAPPPGEEPQVEDAPPAPEEPKLPDKPTPPVLAEADPSAITQMESQIDWEAADPGVLAEYRARVKAVRLSQQSEYEALLRAWEAECDQAKAAWQVAQHQHENALAGWGRDKDGFGARHKAWSIAKARNQAVRAGLFSQWLINLGLFWEYLNQGGPRGINGQPMFYSMRLLSRADLDRANPVIEREFARMKELPL